MNSTTPSTVESNFVVQCWMSYQMTKHFDSTSFITGYDTCCWIMLIILLCCMRQLNEFNYNVLHNWEQKKFWMDLDWKFDSDQVSFNPLSPRTCMKMHILLTVLHTFCMELVRGICLNIKTSHLWWLFPLFSPLECLNKQWWCKQKFHFCHC